MPNKIRSISIIAKLQSNNNNRLSSFDEPSGHLPFKQSFWDRPGVELDRASLEASLVVPYQRAAFRAVTARHSGDWLFTLPISSCGLKLDDEAVRVAVEMRLGMNICIPHIFVAVTRVALTV